jgi:hypothetical protein
LQSAARMSRVKVAVSAIATAERRGGEIVKGIDGKIRPLPVKLSAADRRRWHVAATRSPKEFDAYVAGCIAKALARIGNGADAAAGDASRSRPPASARSSAKRSPAK